MHLGDGIPMAVLPVGDGRRPVIGRACVASLLAACAFMIFALASKEVRTLNVHAPWQDDPYDVFVSFSVFFVPLLVCLCLARITLCRRSEPLPIGRLNGLLRGCRLILAAIVVTLAADWVSVALHADPAAWNGVTPRLIVALTSVSVVAAGAALALRSAQAGLPIAPGAGAEGGDWLADVVAAADRYARMLGPFASESLRLLRAVDTYLASRVRGHPLASASLAALGFGVALAAVQAIGEGDGPPASILYVVTGFSGMFAFLVAGGSYLRFVDTSVAVLGLKRRLVDSLVAGCACFPAVVAFRASLRSAVPQGLTRHPWGLVEMGVVIAITAAALVFAGESACGCHRSTRAR